MNRRISPLLWFDSAAVDATPFCCRTVPDPNTVWGDADAIVVGFELSAQRVMAVSGGPDRMLSPRVVVFR